VEPVEAVNAARQICVCFGDDWFGVEDERISFDLPQNVGTDRMETIAYPILPVLPAWANNP
jgi:hypothetical protein